jgi:formylglycine-generating enzyme required for sulfatase activity
MRFDLAAIRELVSAAFSDEELRTFCFDHYRPVYEQFAVGQSKGAWVLALVEYADKHGMLNQLLAQVKAANPHQYEVFESRIWVKLPGLEACPYRGLEYFDVPHAADYFGREVMVAKLIDRLRETNFVAVVGPSGCGKSSLVRAGLIPALRRGDLPGSEGWEVDIFRPGDDPLRSLASPLAARLVPDLSPVDRLAETRKLAEYLAAGTVPIGDVLAQLRQQCPSLPRLVLIADQFEEAFTLFGDEVLRQAFFSALLKAAETPWLAVILTLRADFFGRVLADERLGPRVDRGLVNVLPMMAAERRAAIEQPALRADRAFEEGLVERILDAVEDAPGDLPLLEFALTELWARQTADGLLTHAAYEEIGEVRGAIAQRADSALAGFDPDQREAVRTIFTRLVQVARPEAGAEDTRRRINLEELAPQSAALAQQLADARLLVTGRDPDSGEETIEVAHEALIRGWQQLRDWLNSDREFLLWRQRLRTLADIWDGSGRSEGALLRDALLKEAQVRSQGRSDDLNALELAFIRESELAAESAERAREAARQRELERERALVQSERARAEEGARSAERLRRRAALLAVALAMALLAIVATGWFYRESQNARQNETNARWAQATAAASEATARQTAEASAELAQKQLAQLAGEQLLKEARDLKEKCDVQAAIAKFGEAATAVPGLKLDLKAEEADVRRQCATILVQEGEKLAAAGDHEQAAAKFQEALNLVPPPDTPVYVRIPAGEFTMGSSAADTDATDFEKPQHTVPVGDFWIMRTEVSNAQYLRCVEAGKCTEPENARYDKPQFASEPVTNVDWDQANSYVRWVGGRLPTEAEWEKACRGTDARIYPWGSQPPPNSKLLNFLDSGFGSATDVGSYPDGASPYGLLDMAGNAWEWTSSLYRHYPYKADDGREDPESRDDRVLRGGSFGIWAQEVRCAYRLDDVPDFQNDYFGFRVVSPGF